MAAAREDELDVIKLTEAIKSLGDQIDDNLIEVERMKMKASSLLTACIKGVKEMMNELKETSIQLMKMKTKISQIAGLSINSILLHKEDKLLRNTSQEVDLSKMQIELIVKYLRDEGDRIDKILLDHQITELAEKDKQLEEKDRQVEEKDRLLEERSKQLQESPDSSDSSESSSKNLEPPDKELTSEDRWSSGSWITLPRKILHFTGWLNMLGGQPQPAAPTTLTSSADCFTDCPQGTESGLTSVFIPEMAETYLENQNSDTYRFVCPHAGQFQCKITSLVFEMEGKGEVLYRIVSWDPRLLDGLGQMQPAGPLYNIDCFEGSVSHLHLPHCEITPEENQVELAVAHFTGDNVEVIKPLKVTNTHVVVNIHGLSLFGLLLSKIFPARPISAQVLFFYKPIADMKNLKQLHIHLLPGNVPVREVQNQHMDFKHITTSSTADTLVPNRNYKPTCDHYTPEPEVATFKCVFGPNYHPTFVVYLEANHVTVSLLDENDVEVWRPHQLYLTGCRKDTVMSGVGAGAAFVEAHMETLIQRVSIVMEITDCLKSKNMISDETYNNIRAAGTSQEKMRVLYEALQSGGRAVKDEFYGILKEKLPFLVEELESGPSQA